VIAGNLESFGGVPVIVSVKQTSIKFVIPYVFLIPHDYFKLWSFFSMLLLIVVVTASAYYSDFWGYRYQ